MIAVSVIAAVLTVIPIIAGRGYEKALLSGRKKGGLPVFLKSGGLFLYDRVRKYVPENRRVLEMERALLVKRAEKRLKTAETAGLALLIVFFGSVLCFVLALREKQSETVTSVLRPYFGEERQEALSVQGLEGTGDVSVHVTGRVPTGAGMDALFDIEYEELLPVILGENTDFQHVTEKLDFQQESGRGMRVLYKSSIPEYLSDYGYVFQEELPKNGADVNVRITLIYEEEQKSYDLPVHVMIPEEPDLTEKERLEQLLLTLDQDSLTDEALVLPEEFEEQRVSFKAEGTPPYAVLVLAVVVALCLVFLPEERMKARMKAREKELRRSYPNVLSKLGTLIGAGMSIYGAWTRVVRDYEESLKAGRRKPEFAYEEMRITVYEIQSGTSEDAAYAAYGKRCGLHSYIKFGNMLGQNVRQGISGLTDALREEMSSALEERKTEALRLGELAGTRLLFPMLMMLGVVIISLVIPAFMSF